MIARNITRIALGLAMLGLLMLPSASLAQGTMFVKSNNVGIGKANPTVKLDVLTDGGGSALTVMKLANNGFPRFFLTNTNTGDEWQMSPFATAFNISLGGTGGNEFQVLKTGGFKAGPGAATVIEGFPNGNMTIAGTLTSGSSRAWKKNIQEIAGADVLQTLASVPIATWSYTSEDVRHLGPMAEDFSAAFGLGVDEKHLAPGDAAGVALAAAKGLYELALQQQEQLERKDAVLEALQARLDNLEARIGDR